MIDKPTFFLEYRIVKRDGDVGNMQPRYLIERVFKNSPLRAANTDQDISDQKRAEETLQESKKTAKELINALTDFVGLIDTQGIILDVNEAMAQRFDSEKYELIGLHGWDLLPQDLAKQREAYAEQVIQSGKSVRFEDERQGIWFDNAFFPVFNTQNKVIKIAILARDITDRKQAEKALREREERYRTVLETNPDPVVIYDMEGKVVYLNPAFTNVFGWTLEERSGKKMDIFVPDENWSETQMMINKGFAGENFSGIESRRYTKEGDILDVSISGAVYLDPQGKAVRTVVNLRDITEQKKLETHLQQAQKMEALGTLAGGIAHDFNNLLMGIQGRTSLMLLDTDSSHPYLEHLQGIENYVKSAADLTKQLLGFAGGGKYEVKPTDFNEIIERTSSMFGRTKKEITIHRKYQKDVWIVEVDQSQIDQVLLNLYVNAWQAMPGGGDLYIETENVTFDENSVKPFAIEPGNYVRISITDTGVGMDEATQKRIFEPFFTTKEMGRGMGLGLASVYGIIKNHGGIINVYSKRGQGSTFNIYLPASEKKLIEEERKEIPDDLLRGEETILLVDDEDMIIDVGKQILKRLGYNVLLAQSGKEAVDIYEENKDMIDMVILDMIMPDMDGGEVYDRLKGTNPEIKVLLATGYSIDEQATEILNRGCNGFIQKPFNIEELSHSLREILDQEKS